MVGWQPLQAILDQVENSSVYEKLLDEFCPIPPGFRPLQVGESPETVWERGENGTPYQFFGWFEGEAVVKPASKPEKLVMNHKFLMVPKESESNSHSYSYIIVNKHKMMIADFQLPFYTDRLCEAFFFDSKEYAESMIKNLTGEHFLVQVPRSLV